jgi:DnaJ-class molecular chaperone
MCRDLRCEHTVTCVRCLGRGSYTVTGLIRECHRCQGTGVLTGAPRDTTLGDGRAEESAS